MTFPSEGDALAALLAEYEPLPDSITVGLHTKDLAAWLIARGVRMPGAPDLSVPCHCGCGVMVVPARLPREAAP